MQRSEREAMTVECGGPLVYSYKDLISSIAGAAGRNLRWTHLVGQFGGLDKLGSGCRQAANLSTAGAQYVSSGVRPASMECGRLVL